jgi:hypothetical protein
MEGVYAEEQPGDGRRNEGCPLALGRRSRGTVLSKARRVQQCDDQEDDESRVERVQEDAGEVMPERVQAPERKVPCMGQPEDRMPET